MAESPHPTESLVRREEARAGVGALSGDPEPCQLRIVAVGSPFGADRIAWDAIEALGPLPSGVEAVCCVSPLSELPAMLRGAQSVLLVDAMLDVPMGTAVRCNRDALKTRERELSSHGLSVDLALDLAAALGELPPRLEIVGLGIGGDVRSTKVSHMGAARHYAAVLRDEIHHASPPPVRRGVNSCQEASA